MSELSKNYPGTGDIRLRIEMANANRSFRLFYQIKTELSSEYRYDFPLFYGGGITSANIEALYASDKIDGLLLGNFCKHVKNVVNFLEKDVNSTSVDNSLHD